MAHGGAIKVDEVLRVLHAWRGVIDVALEVVHAWGVIVGVVLHITQACGAIVGVVLHHVIHACGDIGMVAHRGFFIDIILGPGVPRHASQDQVLYMEVVEGVRDTTSNLTLPWKIVSCKWPHLRAINQAK